MHTENQPTTEGMYLQNVATSAEVVFKQLFPPKAYIKQLYPINLLLRILSKPHPVKFNTNFMPK